MNGEIASHEIFNFVYLINSWQFKPTQKKNTEKRNA